MSGFVSIVQILEDLAMRVPISETELSDIGRLALAIEHAISVAQALPTTLDAGARDHIITKLQEAEHWSFELIRFRSTRCAAPRGGGSS